MNRLAMKQGLLILYHYPCADGAYAALMARLSRSGNAMRFVPHRTDEALDIFSLPIDNVSGVVLLDYCGPSADFLRALCNRYPRVVLIDHHQTAFDMIKGMEGVRNLETLLVADVSGCALAEHYFEPRLTPQQREVMLYIEDNDLWRHRMPDSEAFSAGLSALNIDYRTDFLAMRDIDVAATIAKGRPILAERDAYVTSAVAASVATKTGGFRVYVHNDMPKHISHLGHALATESAASIGLVVWALDAERTRFKVSARSVNDVDTIAAVTGRYQGGGHRSASGCVVTREQLEGEILA
jgi:oligoribonuclease NrnB/cAMP/cGMP phosphodiesterase (DHH superfamily)